MHNISKPRCIVWYGFRRRLVCNLLKPLRFAFNLLCVLHFSKLFARFKGGGSDVGREEIERRKGKENEKISLFIRKEKKMSSVKPLFPRSKGIEMKQSKF